MVRAGKLSTEIALHVLEYLDKETDYVPWVAAAQQLSYLDDMLRRTKLYGQFNVCEKQIVFNFLMKIVT